MSFTIHHITLNVSDLERARAFYEGVLGLRVDQDFPGEKVRLRLDGTATRLVLVLPLPGTPAGDRFTANPRPEQNTAPKLLRSPERNKACPVSESVNYPVIKKSTSTW